LRVGFVHGANPVLAVAHDASRGLQSDVGFESL
jgi:hypothetical protein